uniref:Uncharacterized protein n=1 Tax=Anguilla anguilla TaxID=7936 RepID=A0A0E9S7M3_ANGAN
MSTPQHYRRGTKTPHRKVQAEIRTHHRATPYLSILHLNIVMSRLH